MKERKDRHETVYAASGLTRRDFLRVGGTGLVGAALLGLNGCSEATQGGQGSGGGDFPSGDLTLIAAGSPGGGLDIQSRMVQQAFHDADLVDVQLEIENMGGGGGNPARAALLNRPNNGRTLVTESNRIFLNPLIGTTDLTVEDFTPVAKLTVEYEVWAVQADSQWESATQVLDAVKEDPEAVSFGVGTVPSDDQFNILAPAQRAGVKDISQLNITVFEEGGDLTTNLIGGNVDVASASFSELSEQARQGEVRILVVSSPQPQSGVLDGVPTWKELGIDFTRDHWRGVFGPADMPQDALQWWVDTLRQASNTDSWQQQADRYELTPDFEPAEEFGKTIERQRANAKQLLQDVGQLNSED